MSADFLTAPSLREELEAAASRNGQLDDDPEPQPMAAPGEIYPTSGNDGEATRTPAAWLLDAADLLAEPDPGPTAWLVDELIVERAIVAFVGRWKTTKSYAILDMCISIAAGEPAFGELAIPDPGPVVFVNEESGRAALWRRLDALCRGRAISPERLRDRLFVAANARQRLDDETTQRELLEIGERRQPRLFVFDPLARMKAPGREENAQTDMAVLIEFLRELREQTGAAVGFVHHTGHTGDTMRGSSDLESFWESRLAWKRDGQSPLVEIHSEHREAEAGPPIRYRISYDHDTRSMRFPLVATETVESLRDRITSYVTANPKQKAREIATGIDVRGNDVDRELANLVADRTLTKSRSGRLDKLGREIRDEVYTTLDHDLRCGSSQTLFQDEPRDEPPCRVPDPDETGRTTPANPHHSTTSGSSHSGTNQDEPHDAHRGSVARPSSIRGTSPDEPPDEAPT